MSEVDVAATPESDEPSPAPAASADEAPSPPQAPRPPEPPVVTPLGGDDTQCIVALGEEIDEPGVEEAIAWTRAILEPHDLSRLAWLRINLGGDDATGADGRTQVPTEARPTYRISCQVPGPFPLSVPTHKVPLYRNDDGTWPPEKDSPEPGTSHGEHRLDTKSDLEWVEVFGETTVRDRSEAIVWIGAREAFHFLHHTRQGPGASPQRDVEAQADAYADEQLEAFRESMGTTPAPTVGGTEIEIDTAAPILLHQLTDENERVRAKAAEALGALGVHGEVALPALTRALEDPKPDVRDQASRSLRSIQAAIARARRKAEEAAILRADAAERERNARAAEAAIAATPDAGDGADRP